MKNAERIYCPYGIFRLDGNSSGTCGTGTIIEITIRTL
jgi:hypothetical protein